MIYDVFYGSREKSIKATEENVEEFKAMFSAADSPFIFEWEDNHQRKTATLISPNIPVLIKKARTGGGQVL